MAKRAAKRGKKHRPLARSLFNSSLGLLPQSLTSSGSGHAACRPRRGRGQWRRGEANDLLSTFILAVPATVPRSVRPSVDRKGIRKARPRPPPAPPPLRLNRISSQDADFSSVRPSSRSQRRRRRQGIFCSSSGICHEIWHASRRYVFLRIFPPSFYPVVEAFVL